MQLTLFIESIKKYAEKISRVWAEIGTVFAGFMLAVVFIDVIGSKLLMKPLFGAGDMVAIFQLIAICSFIPLVQFLRGNTEVDFFVNAFGAKAKKIIEIFVATINLFLFVLLTWKTFQYGIDLQPSGENVGNLAFPLFPFAYFASLCFFIGCIVMLSQLFSAIAALRRRS